MSALEGTLVILIFSQCPTVVLSWWWLAVCIGEMGIFILSLGAARAWDTVWRISRWEGIWVWMVWVTQIPVVVHGHRALSPTPSPSPLRLNRQEHCLREYTSFLSLPPPVPLPQPPRSRILPVAGWRRKAWHEWQTLRKICESGPAVSVKAQGQNQPGPEVSFLIMFGEGGQKVKNTWGWKLNAKGQWSL